MAWRIDNDRQLMTDDAGYQIRKAVMLRGYIEKNAAAGLPRIYSQRRLSRCVWRALRCRRTMPGTQEQDMTPYYATLSKGMCQHCTHCNVQVGIAWNRVYFCERDKDAVKPVGPADGCGAYVREPGADDER